MLKSEISGAAWVQQIRLHVHLVQAHLRVPSKVSEEIRKMGKQ
jgi:hypothetical protein